MVLVARGLRRHHAKSEARRPFPHSQFGFSAVLRGWYCAGGLVPSMGGGIALFSFRRSSNICQATGLSAKNASPLSGTTYKLGLLADRRPWQSLRPLLTSHADMECDGSRGVRCKNRREIAWHSDPSSAICDLLLNDGDRPDLIRRASLKNVYQYQIRTIGTPMSYGRSIPGMSSNGIATAPAANVAPS